MPVAGKGERFQSRKKSKNTVKVIFKFYLGVLRNEKRRFPPLILKVTGNCVHKSRPFDVKIRFRVSFCISGGFPETQNQASTPNIE